MFRNAANTHVLGVLLILAAMSLLAIMDSVAKVLMVGGMAVVQMLALRSWIIVPLMTAWALRTGGVRGLRVEVFCILEINIPLCSL